MLLFFKFFLPVRSSQHRGVSHKIVLRCHKNTHRQKEKPQTSQKKDFNRTMDENQSEKKPTPQGSGFHPHSGRLLDATFFYVLFEPLLKFIQPVMIVIYATRWELARPLQIRVFPSWFPFVDISGIKDLPFLTIGQVLLAIPLVILILSGYYFTFVAPDVETSGKVASYAIFATFLTANKSNSLTAFFLGIPFERMIPYHNLSSLTTVVLSLFHGYVAFAYGEGDRRKLESSEDTSSGDSQQYGLMGSNPNLLKFLFDGENNTSGSLLALAMFVLVLSSIFPIFRRNFFDFWLWIHILLACCVIIFCVMHEVTSILFVALWW